MQTLIDLFQQWPRIFFFKRSHSWTFLFILTALNSDGELSREKPHLPLGDHEEPYNDCRIDPTIEDSFHSGDYEASILRSADGVCGMLNITRNGQLIYHREEIGTHFYFGPDFGDQRNPFSHLTRLDRPDFIVSEYTGGAHCCYLLHIFDLEDSFRKIATIEGGNFSPLLEDLDGDGLEEIKLDDDFLAYRFADFSRTAVGSVILKYSNGAFKVAAEAMKRNPPNRASLGKKIKTWRKRFLAHDFIGDAPSSFIQQITDLFFSGHREIALEVIEQSWPVEVSGKDQFIKSYEQALMESRYYTEFENINL